MATTELSSAWVKVASEGWVLTDRVATIPENAGDGVGVRMVIGALPKSTGKRYCEIRKISSGTYNNSVRDEYGLTPNPAPGNSPSGLGTAYRRGGRLFRGGAELAAPAVVDGAVIGIAMDLDAGAVWFSLNGAWVTGDPAAGSEPAFTGLASGVYYPAASSEAGSSCSVQLRTIGSEFSYPVPAGFVSWGTTVGTANYLDYPDTLPGPVKAQHVPKNRVRSSELAGSNTYENFQSDYTGTMPVEFFLNAAQIEIFYAWWRDDLLQGGRWFNCSWPALRPGPLVAQITDDPSWNHVYNGAYRVSCTVQVRGVSRAVVKPKVSILRPEYLWQTDPSIGITNVLTFADNNQRMLWTPTGVGSFFTNRTVTALAGKVYCEFEYLQRTNSLPAGLGVQPDPIGTSFYTNNPEGWSFFSGNGGCGLPVTGSYYGEDFVGGSFPFSGPGERLRLAFDTSTKKLWVGKGDAWFASGNPGAGTNAAVTLTGAGPYYFTASTYSCNVTTPIDLAIYPREEDQLFDPPPGFSPYQPD